MGLGSVIVENFGPELPIGSVKFVSGGEVTSKPECRDRRPLCRATQTERIVEFSVHCRQLGVHGKLGRGSPNRFYKKYR